MANTDKQVRNLLKNYALNEKTSFIKGFVLSLLNTILQLLSPLIIGYIINNLLKKGITSADFTNIIKYLILYFLVNMIASLFLNRAFITFQIASNDIAYQMQNDVYNKVNSFPIAYFDNLPAGKISSRITNDTNKVKMLFKLIITDITTSMILLSLIHI